MKPITFCIPTGKNEKDYIFLLLKSLKDNTQIYKHEVLVFVDTDNQGTYEALVEYKKENPYIKIYRNESGIQIGSQRNITIMFQAATNDIVCYIQSDMVVGKDLDKHISETLVDGDTIVACTRIEPPLHPPSPEKIIKDFGVTPETFDYKSFNDFVLGLQKENRPNEIAHFAPFAVYKSTWFTKLGGFDTQFRCSREDSDFILRCELNRIKMIQTWKACVYHFTCVSSRGKDWFKNNDISVKFKNQLQAKADEQELKRFLRKWGFFGHTPKPIYDTSVFINVDYFSDINDIKMIEPYFKRLYLTDKNVVDELTRQLEHDAHYYSNLRYGHTKEHFYNNKNFFNYVPFSDRIIYSTDIGNVHNGIVLSFTLSEFKEKMTKEVENLIVGLNTVASQLDLGKYSIGHLTLSVRDKTDLSDSYKRTNEVDKDYYKNYIFI